MQSPSCVYNLYCYKPPTGFGFIYISFWTWNFATTSHFRIVHWRLWLTNVSVLQTNLRKRNADFQKKYVYWRYFLNDVDRLIVSIKTNSKCIAWNDFIMTLNHWSSSADIAQNVYNYRNTASWIWYYAKEWHRLLSFYFTSSCYVDILYQMERGKFFRCEYGMCSIKRPTAQFSNICMWWIYVRMINNSLMLIIHGHWKQCTFQHSYSWRRFP